MDTQEQSIIQSLLTEIGYLSNRLETLSDKLDSKLEGSKSQEAESTGIGLSSGGIIISLQSIKKRLEGSETSLQASIDKM